MRKAAIASRPRSTNGEHFIDSIDWRLLPRI